MIHMISHAVVQAAAIIRETNSWAFKIPVWATSRCRPHPSAYRTIQLPRRKVQPRVVAATVAGNALEFFDFTTYAFFAVYIGQTFFLLTSRWSR